MSKITTIYNAITTKLQTTLPTFQRIANPYTIDENTAILMKRAYGLAIGEGTNTARYVGCLTTWERSFTIGLVTQVVTTENDATGRANIEKEILEAHKSLLTAFEVDPTLGAVCIKAVIESDGGINYIDGARSKFLAVELTLRVEYQEQTA